MPALVCASWATPTDDSQSAFRPSARALPGGDGVCASLRTTARAATSTAARASTADGVISMGCGEDCLNRSLFIECDPRSCPCRDACRNQLLSRGLTAPTEPFPTAGKG